MKPLEPPDNHHLRAALGWIGLGNFQEANEELEKITPQLRAHPDVLTIRYEITSLNNAQLDHFLFGSRSASEIICVSVKPSASAMDFAALRLGLRSDRSIMPT